MRGLLVNFKLVQFKEGLKIQSPHQNNKPPAPPKKGGGGGDYINVYIYTVEPLHNGHPSGQKKVAVAERWPLWGGRGVI